MNPEATQDVSREYVERRLAEYFSEKEGDDILETIREVDLVDEGFLDSLDFLSLALFIEKSFSVKLDLTHEATFRSLRTFNGICDLIENVGQ